MLARRVAEARIAPALALDAPWRRLMDAAADLNPGCALMPASNSRDGRQRQARRRRHLKNLRHQISVTIAFHRVSIFIF
jgi:hypothetical protein